MRITSNTYNSGIWKQGIQFQIDHYFEPKSHWAKTRIRRVLDFLKPKKGEKILDVGCGVGTFAFHSAKYGAFGYGLDYSKEPIKMAKLIASKYNLSKKTKFVVANATKIPFKDGYFDKVVSADFIEHIGARTTKQVFKEMLRVLKKNGLLIIYTPNRNPQILHAYYQKLKRLLALRGPHTFNLLTPTPVHVGLKNPREIKKLLEGLGAKCKVHLFARDFNLPYIPSHLWHLICEKVCTNELLSERILVIATYEK